jgi:DNA helicase TIP49 (TBP-interacting protein)
MLWPEFKFLNRYGAYPRSSSSYFVSCRPSEQKQPKVFFFLKGDVHKRKEVIQDVTLHDLDVANAR